MMIHLPLHTERLVLRDFEEADWEAVHCYASDPEVVRYMSWGPNTEEDTRGFIQRKLAESGVGDVLNEAGYVPVGSYAMHTMTWRDLDFERPEETPDWERH